MIRTLSAGVVAITMMLCSVASASVTTPKFKRGDFSKNPVVTNPYDPLIPGTVLYYGGSKEGKPQTDRFEVTGKRATILGVHTTVIHDQVFVDGHLHENTLDWYAQDKAGNVWYFGEKTEELAPGGEVEDTEGSWQAGKRVSSRGPKAAPGIFMPAPPELGVGFKQEVAPGVSEDEFEPVDLNATISTPYITTNRALQTHEFSPGEPGVLDTKYFVLGIGDVIEETLEGPEDHLALVNVERR